MRKDCVAALLTFAGLLALGLSGCGPTYVQPVQSVQSSYQTGWNGDPCNQSYFDAMACQTAIGLGGWYLNGVLVHHYYGGYGYDHYYQMNHIYVLHGGRVTPYGQAVRTVRPVQPASSVGSASKSYVPPSQRAPATSSASVGKPYTPPSRPASRPASSYSPPSRRK